MGVSEETIEKYSVYSLEVAKEMSKQISMFTNSNYGVGVTGKLNRQDINNLYGKDNRVFVSIYDKDNDEYHTMSIDVDKQTRKENKQLVIDIITNSLITLLN